MATAVTQFYKSFVVLGTPSGSGPYSPVYPVLPTATLVKPVNFIIPPIIGNYWQWNYAEGFQQPAVDLIFIVRDKGIGGAFSEVLSSTFLNYWLTRSSDVSHDTSIIASTAGLGATNSIADPVNGGYCGLLFWDGQSGFALGGCKAESFSISASKGQLLQFTGRFLFNYLTTLSAAPTVGGWDNSVPITGKNCQVKFAGSNAPVWNVGLSFANNHTPDMAIDGTNLPANNNAGMMTAGLNLTVQAATTTVVDNNAADFGGSAMTAGAISLVITGNAASTPNTRTFTITNPIDQSRDNRTIGLGRVMREHSYVALGGDGQTSPPLTIS